MISESRTIKRNAVNARGFGSFRNKLPYLARRIPVAGRRQARLNILLQCRGGGHSTLTIRFDDLCVDMAWRTMYAEAVIAKVANLRPGPKGAAHACCLFIHTLSCPLLLLGSLHDDLLADIANALAFVGLWRPVGAYIRRYLTHFLLVDSGHHDFRLARRFNTDAIRNLVYYRVREAKRQIQRLALRLRPITHAPQLESPREAFRDAVHHVRNDRTHGAGQCHNVLLVSTRVAEQGIIRLLDANKLVHVPLESPLRAFNLYLIPVYGDLDVARYRYGFPCYSGHDEILVRRRRTTPRRRDRPRVRLYRSSHPARWRQ